MSQLIAVDIGNSSVKLGLFTGFTGEALATPTAFCEFPTDANPLVCAHLLPSATASWRVASVNRPAQERLADWVAKSRPGDDYHAFSNSELPIQVNVRFPDRVGADRLAAAVGANRLRQAGHPAIVIDAGTAITVDLVDAEGRFQGGSILPGIGLSASSLAEKTDLLPLVSFDPRHAPPSAIGKSTEEAIHSGLYWGAIGSVREVIRQMETSVGAPCQLFVTGGWAAGMSRLLRTDAIHVPHLVLAGIAEAARSETWNRAAGQK